MNRDPLPSQRLLQHLRDPQHLWAEVYAPQVGEQLGQHRDEGGGGAWTEVFVLCKHSTQVTRVGWQSRRQPGRVPLLSLVCTDVNALANASAGLSLHQLEQLTLDHLPQAREALPVGRLEEARNLLGLIQRAGRRCAPRQGAESGEGLEEPLCHCWGVARVELEAVLRAGQSLRAAQRMLGIGSRCGACGPAMLEVAGRLRREDPPGPL